MEVTEESYEAWRENSADDVGIRDEGQLDMNEIVKKKMLLEIFDYSKA